MKDLMEIMDIKDWLSLNAQLQAKKNTLRKVLKEKGVLPKQGNNKYDNYKYFSEAQYKELFTGLFADCGLELKFDEVAYDTFTGTEKQANGRMPKLEFYLMDMKTGFFETTCITGEGIDKGDKAGYKAYTGALKYYLANTFMVATGDDPEKDSPNSRMNKKEDVRGRKNEEPKVAEEIAAAKEAEEAADAPLTEKDIKALRTAFQNYRVPEDYALRVLGVESLEGAKVSLLTAVSKELQPIAVKYLKVACEGSSVDFDKILEQFSLKENKLEAKHFQNIFDHWDSVKEKCAA